MADVDGKGKGKPLLPFFMVFGGCMSSMVFMEYVLKVDDHAGNLLNATEFVFVLLQSIPGRIDFGSRRFTPLLASWTSHLQHAFLWVTMSTLANVVFAFNITVPIHTLFRSCNVIASVALGWMAFEQRYTAPQVVCVLIITVGIFLGSIGDASLFSSCKDCGSDGSAKAAAEEEKLQDGLFVWSCGVALLVVTQLFQATLGHTQAYFYRRFSAKGSRSELADEYLFTAHVASLGSIVLLWSDISRSWANVWMEPRLVSFIPLPGPVIWMVLNNVFQLMCIKGVFRLSAHYSPLTVNITLSVRKFLSLVLSILWFGNPWTSLHSVATVAIFGGVFAYSQCKPPPPSPSEDAKKEK
mmetsp:Transcript_12848/g.30113  ORF Transcript_12848/g.30113 Transcript_12848/m.30113 type:complete len:354 (+) Transcript_12848:95-1156(+)